MTHLLTRASFNAARRTIHILRTNERAECGRDAPMDWGVWSVSALPPLTEDGCARCWSIRRDIVDARMTPR